MRTETALIIEREDINQENRTKPMSEINREHIKFSPKPFDQAGVVIFIDDDGTSKILKDRLRKI